MAVRETVTGEPDEGAVHGVSIGSAAEWIFGYGSLIWRPAFPYVESRPALVRGFIRRFWQGSTDHRGTPSLPGRVVTLIREPEGTVWGRAFRIAPHHRAEILDRLDVREQGGYERHLVDLYWPEEGASGVGGQVGPRACALLYVAASCNENYVGPSSVGEIADRALAAHGPSGANRDYVLELESALRAMGAEDEHVFAVAAELRRREASSRSD
ncbi:MAG: gamma-glutamylcyclotransferase [Acidobacteria bacterium]|nr:MAG: gamma-glutamylcyclotransferase [Acidobacteriota bacterium]REK03634.1 MAG: gamma-glutamylcyclotransferase [Acidobacteriota bacterium]